MRQARQARHAWRDSLSGEIFFGQAAPAAVSRVARESLAGEPTESRGRATRSPGRPGRVSAATDSASYLYVSVLTLIVTSLRMNDEAGLAAEVYPSVA